ncbi:MAG TPA: cell wall-binding repeat-containing protein, partial [Candidatus Dormibacteraeota bacterium]|nr:cell wall-binding repeat-containing protein [Candidatus Dormibacteraeota bacterium]
MRRRVAATLLAAVALLGLAAPVATAATAPAPRIVFVVGSTGSVTATYIQYAETAAAEAAQAFPGATIVKVYSPNATWAAVSAAMQGADFVVYLGHGTGYPGPYPYSAYGSDGMGLNDPANLSDSVTKYYGEWYLANQVRLAPGAVVILSHLCYASGNSEPQNPTPTLDVAQQRMDNYGAGFLAAGATAVIAEAFGDPGGYFRYLAQPGASVQQVWSSRVAAPSWLTYAGDPQSFASARTPGATVWYDPSDPTSDPGVYHRALVVTGTATAGVAPATPERLAGADRYATAAAISAATFAPGVPVAYVATGLGFPDALAAAAAAGKTGSPVLLVSGTSIPASTATELGRLKPGRIVVAGGPTVVSDDVLNLLASYTAGGVSRLAGADRYATAAAISQATFAPGVPVAYIATGLNFPDALSGAAAAGKTGGPVLLVPGDSVPAVVAQEL